MPSRVLVWRVLPVVVALAVAATGLVAVDRATSATSARRRLPDLAQVTPTGLVVTQAAGGASAPYVLGFRSAVSNVGDGPLIIEGHRPGPAVGTMVADQVVERDGAPQLVVPGVGRMQYVVSPDHRHWHLLGFDRYELHHASGRTVAARDQKTGFCLGDRYVETAPLRSSSAPLPVYTSRCGLGEPQLLGVREGISVGYGDNYNANLEGQYLPLTGLRAGRYVLVHRVNADHRLRELDYGNNAASLLLDLRWRGAHPTVRVLKQCPGTDRCTSAHRRARVNNRRPGVAPITIG
jgi:hypothetical protein